MVVATQNPIEQEGTYHLPEAQLDRFLFKINVGYPNLEEEFKIVSNHHQSNTGEHDKRVQPVLSADQVEHLRRLARSVHVEEKLIRFITTIVACHPKQ